MGSYKGRGLRAQKRADSFKIVSGLVTIPGRTAAAPALPVVTAIEITQRNRTQ
jgi:hypothetical protein